MELLGLIIFGVIVFALVKNFVKKASPLPEEENELSGFKIEISSPSGETRKLKSKNKTSAKWVLPGETVKIGNIKVSGGYFYFGENLQDLNQYSTEPSLIDPTLKINHKSPDYKGDNMGYWPSYSDISPQNRAAYIEWLASDRDDPEAYIGYIFLYFYGLERRMFSDIETGNVSAEETNNIISEVKRLNRVYGENGSFKGYSSRFLSHTQLLHSSDTISINLDDIDLEKSFEYPIEFKILVAKTIQKHGFIPLDLALAWMRVAPMFSSRTAAHRCKDEYDQLYAIRYREKYGDGLTVLPFNKSIESTYKLASPTCGGYGGTDEALTEWPDYTHQLHPFRTLTELSDKCCDELDALSRYLGRNDDARGGIFAASLLPEILIDTHGGEHFKKFKSWASVKTVKASGIVSTQELLTQLGEESLKKINKKEALMLAELVEKVGYGIAPDVRHHHAKPEIDGSVILFDKGHGDNFKPSSAFNQLGTVIRLGAMVAAIDGKIDKAEITLLESLISEDKQLNNIEKASLTAYLHWRLNAKINMTGLKARLECIGDKEKSVISQILVSVALADGTVDPTEIKQLEKLYTSLGLDKTMVASDIHNLTSQKTPIKHTTKVAPDNGENKLEIKENAGFALNHELIKLHESETDEVKAVLGSIFADDEIEEEPEAPTPEAVTANNAIVGLDSEHTSFYEKIITKEQWDLDEVKSICEELNLMVNGAIETLNDWAFDNVDAPLIEDGSTVFVDLELVEEIAEL